MISKKLIFQAEWINFKFKIQAKLKRSALAKFLPSMTV